MSLKNRVNQIEERIDPQETEVIWCRYAVAHRPPKPITGLILENPVKFLLPRMPDESEADLWMRFEQEAGPLVRKHSENGVLVGVVFATYD